MADVRLPTLVAGRPAAELQPPARIEAARAAQRAFFQAALTGSGEPAPESRGAVAAPVPSVRTPAQDGVLRPGSLLDIKV